ncbi:snare associated Golgi protein-domain-containing protein [Entophlyctis helioformis]|nr:snare associated Golgi protein-domain-containing protein [Entophlyctis helioformis]
MNATVDASWTQPPQPTPTATTTTTTTTASTATAAIPTATAEHPKGRQSTALRAVAVSASALVAVALAALLVSSHSDSLKRSLFGLLRYIDAHKAAGAVVYIALFGLSTLLSIPASFPTLVAGVIFKPLPLAIAVVLAGSQLGIVLAFALGRTLLRPWVLGTFARDVRFVAIDRALSREGWKVVVLLRLSPLFPFGLCNYLLSMTSMPVWRVMVASLFGNLPGATMYSFLGSLVGNLADTDGYTVPLKTKLLTGLFSLCFCTGSVVYITLVSKRALRESLIESAGFEADSVSESVSLSMSDSEPEAEASHDADELTQDDLLDSWTSQEQPGTTTSQCTQGVELDGGRDGGDLGSIDRARRQPHSQRDGLFVDTGSYETEGEGEADGEPTSATAMMPAEGGVPASAGTRAHGNGFTEGERRLLQWTAGGICLMLVCGLPAIWLLVPEPV